MCVCVCVCVCVCWCACVEMCGAAKETNRPYHDPVPQMAQSPLMATSHPSLVLPPSSLCHVAAPACVPWSYTRVTCQRSPSPSSSLAPLLINRTPLPSHIPHRAISSSHLSPFAFGVPFEDVTCTIPLRRRVSDMQLTVFQLALSTIPPSSLS